MADQFLSPPHGIGGRSDREARTLRGRLGELSQARDRAEAADPPGPARQLGQVYNGGHIPTTALKFFLCHPVTVTGRTTEGTAPMTSVDATVTFPVLVLWHPAKAGDILTAYAVGGRWVSEEGGTGTGTIGPPCAANCPLPNSGSLTWSWTTWPLGGTVYPGSGVATWDGSWHMIAPWTPGASQQFLFTLGCVGNKVNVTVSLYPQGGTVVSIAQCGQPGNTGTGCLILDSYTCGSAFSMSLHVPQAQQAIFGLLQTLTITR
jgi:hypothetical protein